MTRWRSCPRCSKIRRADEGGRLYLHRRYNGPWGVMIICEGSGQRGDPTPLPYDPPDRGGEDEEAGE